MKKKSSMLKALAASAFCLIAVLSWNSVTAKAYSEGDASYYDAYGIGADEGYDYTKAGEAWVPEGLEKNVIRESTQDDEHSIVYIIMADGFTASEQAQFNSEAEAMMDYLMHLCPYSEFKDVTKAYTVFTPSNESGASRDMDYEDYKAAYDAARAEGKAADYNSEEFLPKDTFFNCAFNQLSAWYDYERLLEPSCAGMKRASDVADAYVPEYDQIIIISNSQRYGGSGISTVWPGYNPLKIEGKVGYLGDGEGEYDFDNVNLAVSSINSASKEVAAHEIAHALGNLADEYWPGEVFATENSPNMTQNNDPETVKWKKFMEYSERTNIGIYQYSGSDSWYRPSNAACKMEALSYPERSTPVFYEFCEVCREGFREYMSKFANCTTIHWQDYCKNSTPAVANKLVYGDDDVLDYLEYPTLDGTGYTTSYAYTGTAPEDVEKSFIVLNNGEALADAEIDFTYYNYGSDQQLDAAPSAPGNYTVVATYTGDGTTNSCEVEKSYTISKLQLTKANTTLSAIKDYTYTGKALKPSVTVKYNGKKLNAGTDYTVAYTNNKNPGKATVKITGKGYYTGTLTATFTIKPKAPAISKAVSTKKQQATVSWKKSVGASGYEVYRATKKTGKYTKVATVKSTKTSYTNKKLKSKKGYYYKVRAYKTINGKKVYSGWSGIRGVKVK